MAAVQNPSVSLPGKESDYGSDIDDETAFNLLTEAESQPLKDVVLESIEEPDLKDESLEQRITLRLGRLRQSLEGARKSGDRIDSLLRERQRREASTEIEYQEGNRRAFSRT
jgi:uncharacterized membrane protein YheB (UPF0754 family)